MKSILGTLTVATLTALGATAFLGSSTNEARAQSPCLSQCVNSGSSEATCRTYCLGNQAPQVYGYYYGPGSQNFPPAAYSSSDFSDYSGRPVARCWPGYSNTPPTYPCWAQEALSREHR